MFDVKLVRKGLRGLRDDAALKIEEAKTSSQEEVEKVRTDYARRRELLAETYEYMARWLQAGGRLTRSQITGKDLSALSPELQKRWEPYREDSWFQEFDDMASSENEAQRASRFQKKEDTPTKEKGWYEDALNLMDAYGGEKISQSAWTKMGFSGTLLADAVRRGSSRDSK